MSGDWIKMRSDLHTHPKVVRIASALHADRLRIVGGLHAVWCLFDAHAEDGKLEGYTPSALNELIGFDGFCEAMQVVGWIEFDGESLSVPRFDAHNGQSAKRRATETERKRNDRKLSAPDADKTRTREEKRREEINPSEAKASGGEPPKVTDPDEIIFGYGVPLLTNAGTAEKQARSFLGGLRKQHGDTALIDKLRDCLKAKPLQPLEWLAAALPPATAGPPRNGARAPSPENFASKDYGTGGLL